MEYDQTYTIGKSIIHISGPENPSKNQIEAILDECHIIAKEIIQEIAENTNEKCDGQE